MIITYFWIYDIYAQFFTFEKECVSQCDEKNLYL